MSLGALLHRIDENASKITANAVAILQQSSATAGAGGPSMQLQRRATLGPGYLLARRSVRLWPIVGESDDDLWQGVGEFLHDMIVCHP